MRHILRSKNRTLFAVTPLAVAVSGLFFALLPPRHAPWIPASTADARAFGERSGCRDSDVATGGLLSQRTVEPGGILSCETAEMTIKLGTSCVSAPLHVMISLDRSGSMLRGGALAEARSGALALLDALDLKRNPNTLVGVVSHGRVPRVDIRPSNDHGSVRGRISGVSASANVDDNLAGSVREAQRQLAGADAPFGESARRIIVVFSDGETDGDPNKERAARNAARDAKGDGTILFSVCVANTGSNCGLMAEMATSRGHSFASGNRSLIGAFRTIADRMRAYAVDSVDYTEVLPVGLEIISGTVKPALHVSSDLSERRLSWRIGPLPGEDPTGPVTRTIKFSIRPTTPQPSLPVTYTLRHAEATFQDNAEKAHLGTIRVPTATLRVLGACPDRVEPTVPAPPPQPPSPTPPDPPAATPAPTPTADRPPPGQLPPPERVQPWPTRVARYQIALPIAQLYRCPERAEPPDTVLLLDVSTSMAGLLADGRTKRDGARWAARQFLNEMLRGDRAALLTFGEDARLSPAGLTSRVPDLRRDLLSQRVLQPRPGSRIDRALAAGIAVLEQGARPDQMRQPVIVLITDGRLWDDAQVAEAKALAKRFDQGYLRGYGNTGRLFTIAVDGLGSWDEADRQQRHELLRDLASKRDYAYVVESADALAATAAAIAAEQRCQESSDRG